MSLNLMDPHFERTPMRPILIALCLIAACLCCCPAAHAGPLCRLGGFALRAASAPVRAARAVGANRREARQSRRAAGCN
jgi:hypothetical protein